MKRFKKISKILIVVSLITVSAFALLKTGVLGKEKNAIIVDPNARYDIVADLDGGKFEPGSKPEFVKMDNGKWLYKYKPSMLPTKLPKPVKDGFEFAGWVVDNSETPKPEYSIPAWNKENINLRAEWKVLKAVLLPGPEFNSKVEAIPGFKDVTEIHFIKGMPNSNGIDLSEAQNGSIRGHISGNILTIACINQIFANPDCSKMFYGFGRTLWGTNKVLNKIEFSNFDTSHAIDMGYMFYDCSSLISLDVGNFDTSKVTDMEYMFCGCEKLINIGVGNFDTSQVTDMKSMFNSCSSLVSLDVGNFDTSQVTNMRYMFYACRKLTALDLNNFNTSQVVDMNHMFYMCSALSNLDLSNWNVTNVTNMSWMFSECSKLNQLNLSGFTPTKVENMNSMFNACTKLSGEITVSGLEGVTYSGMFTRCSSDSNAEFWVKWTSLKAKEVAKQMVNTKREGIDHVYLWEPESILISGSKFNELFGVGSNINSNPNAMQMLHVTEINFLKEPLKDGGIDVSAKQDGSIKAYIEGSSLNIRCEGKIIANSDCTKLFADMSQIEKLNLENFDSSKVTNMSYIFKDFHNISKQDLTKLDTSNVTNMQGMFKGSTQLIPNTGNEPTIKETINVSTFDTSKVINMREMFSECSALANIDLNSFNLSKVTNVSEMFAGSWNLTEIRGLQKIFDSKITLMNNIFIGCSKLNGEITIKSESLEGLNIEQMFLGCSSNSNAEFWVKYISTETKNVAKNMVATKREGIDHVYLWDPSSILLPGLEFQAEVKKLNLPDTVVRLAFIRGIPSNLRDFKTIDVSNAKDNSILAYIDGDTLYVASDGKIMANEDSSYLFAGAKIDGEEVNYLNFVNFTNLTFDNLDTSNVTNMTGMFLGTGLSSLQSIDISNFDTSNVTDMSCMFYGCSKLISLDLSNFDTSQVTSMRSMFDFCISLTSLDVSNFNTSSVTNMSYMFRDCDSLTSLDVSNFNTSNVTNMSYMFVGCISLTSLDVSNFNTSNVTDMSYMFSMETYSNNLTDIKGLENFDTSKVTDMNNMFYYCRLLTSLDVSNFNTSNVTNMSCMFRDCDSLTSLDVSSFDTSKVTDMRFMFKSCSSLTSLNVSSFDTSKVTDMGHMFRYCSSLTNLDLSNFDTSNVTTMVEMFNDCNLLTSLDLSNFNTSQVKDMALMFYECSKLTSIKGIENFDVSQVTDMDNMFYNCWRLTSLDLSKWDTSNVTNMSNMFLSCNNLSGEITIMNPNITYTYMFRECSINSPAKFIVNYKPDCKDIAQKIVATKSYNSDVVLGAEIQSVLNNQLGSMGVQKCATYKKLIVTPKPVKLTLINGPSAQYPKQVIQITNNKIPNLNAPDLNPLYAGQFGGYYYDEQFTKPVKQGDIITRDLTIYARW